MSWTRPFVLTAAVAVVSVGASLAEERTVWESGYGSAPLNAATVETRNLFANAESSADTIEVFHGRWRPYWRGYYHGSSGFAPRPNLWYGPIVTPRYYASRPAPVVAFATPCPCPSSVVLTSASPVSPSPSQSNPLPKTPPVPSESFYRYDGGPNSTIPPVGSFRPAETAEPPLAVDTSINRRVNSAPGGKATQYLAYGETPNVVKTNAVVVKKR